MEFSSKAIWLMVLVALFQSSFSALVKLLGNDITTGVAVLSYYVIPLLFLLPICIHSKGELLKTDKLAFLFFRGIMASCAVFCFFYAAKNVSLAVAAVLFNSMPIFVVLFAHLFLNERCSKQVWAAIIIALLGIILVLHPGVGSFFKLGSFIGLSAAILMAISQVMLRSLVNQKMKTTQIVFFLYLMASISSALIILIESLIAHQSLIGVHLGNDHISFVVFILLLLGLSSLISQRTMTYAFQFMPATKLVPVLFVSVPASGLIGWLFWSQHIGARFCIGAVLIFLGIMLITFDKK